MRMLRGYALQIRPDFSAGYNLDTTKRRIEAAPERETPGDRDSLLAE